MLGDIQTHGLCAKGKIATSSVNKREFAKAQSARDEQINSLKPLIIQRHKSLSAYYYADNV